MGIDGIAPPASALTNRVDDGTTITDDSGDHQSTSTGNPFLCALGVTVTDAGGTPQSGFAVDFSAPDAGASALLTDGVITGTTLRVITDADGVASVSAIANDIAGDYVVTAQLFESSSPPVDFAMSNVEGLIFSNGFDFGCSPPLMP